MKLIGITNLKSLNSYLSCARCYACHVWSHLKRTWSLGYETGIVRNNGKLMTREYWNPSWNTYQNRNLVSYRTKTTLVFKNIFKNKSLSGGTPAYWSSLSKLSQLLRFRISLGTPKRSHLRFPMGLTYWKAEIAKAFRIHNPFSKRLT